MSKTMSLLVALSLSATRGVNAAQIGGDNPAGRTTSDRVVTRSYHPWGQKLFSAVRYRDTDKLERLLKEECERVHRIFPEAQQEMRSLASNTDSNEHNLIASALSPSLLPVLIKVVTEYSGSRLARYQLQELVREKEVDKGWLHSAIDLGKQFLMGDACMQEETPVQEQDDQVLYFRVESIEPRSSLTVKSNYDGSTLLELAKAQEEAKNDEVGGASMAPYRTCVELLEQQPAALMRAYVAHSRQGAQVGEVLGA